MLKELKQSIYDKKVINFPDVSIKEMLTNVILLMHTNPDIEFEHIKPTLINLFEGVPDVPENKEHPINVLLEHQRKFAKRIKVIEELLEDFPNNNEDILLHLTALKNINNYYNVKEKLLFPILERHGQFQLPRRMWESDDYLRVSLQAMQKRVAKHETVDPRHIHSTFREVQSTFEHLKEMESFILYPLCFELFTDTNWQQVAREATAFHIDMLDYVTTYDDKKPELDDRENHGFGSGFLTMKEANLILNHLPLELTFIDSQGIFKYFNNITEAQDMIFVRTPLSIGRHVANCHPPMSLSRMMQVMRALKTRQEEKVTMWFKKGKEFVHVTYTAVFDEDDMFRGVLEYVQDIQPFLELPRTTKKHM